MSLKMLLIQLMKEQKRYVKREEAGLFDRFDRLSQIGGFFLLANN